MTRKQFITIIDTIIGRLERGAQLYTCNEIDAMCLGGLDIESSMRIAYENLMGEYKGYIPVGFYSSEGYQIEHFSFNRLNAEQNARRVAALCLFRESILKSKDYKGFEYEKK